MTDWRATVVANLIDVAWVGAPKEVRFTIEHQPLLNWCRITLKTDCALDVGSLELSGRFQPTLEFALAASLATTVDSLLISGPSRSHTSAFEITGIRFRGEFRASPEDFHELFALMCKISPPDYIETYLNGVRIGHQSSVPPVADVDEYVESLSLNKRAPGEFTLDFVQHIARASFFAGRARGLR